MILPIFMFSFNNNTSEFHLYIFRFIVLCIFTKVSNVAYKIPPGRKMANFKV